MVPMLTLSWLCASVEREKTEAGPVCLSASAVIADAAICIPLKPWCSPACGSSAERGTIRFGGSPPLNFSSTTSAS